MKNLISIICLSLIASCTSETPEPKKEVKSESPQATAPAQQKSKKAEAKKDLFGDSVVSGTVLFKGEVPASKNDPSRNFPECQVKEGESKPEDFEKRHDPIRAEGGKLQNVFVYIKEGIPSSSVYPTPDKPVELDQRYCAYKPRVLGMQMNQGLMMVNSDPGLHNVHSMAKNSKNFNLGMPIKDMKMSRTFAKEEVMVRIKCDVHPWMASYVGVLPHPFFSVTDKTGNFELEKLPAGEYTVAAWHEKLGTKEQQISIKPGENVTLEFDFTP